MCFYKFQYGMVCIAYLYEHPAHIIFSPGSSTNLFHQLEGAFINPKVGEV